MFVGTNGRGRRSTIEWTRPTNLILVGHTGAKLVHPQLGPSMTMMMIIASNSDGNWPTKEIIIDQTDPGHSSHVEIYLDVYLDISNSMH